MKARVWMQLPWTYSRSNLAGVGDTVAETVVATPVNIFHALLNVK